MLLQQFYPLDGTPIYYVYLLDAHLLWETVAANDLMEKSRMWFH
jgi:hypothetical protein